MIEGFILGLATSPGCLTVCAPVILPFIVSENKKPVTAVLKFISGRFVSYIFFGFASGLTGIYFNGRINPKIFGVFLFLMALWMVAYSFGTFNLKNSFCRFAKRKVDGRNYPFFAGTVMGLNLCPPFLIGVSRTIAMGSIFKPVLFFSGFFLGTSLWMIPLLLSGRINKYGPVQISGRVLSFLAGGYYIYHSLVILFE